MSVKVIDIDHGYAQIMRNLQDLQTISVEVGVQPDGGDPDIALIALWQEFGTSTNTPERSFLRSTMDENRAKYAALVADATDKVYFKNAKPKNMWAKIGKIIVFDVQRKISHRIPPPNEPSTIEKKGSDVPLVDTGKLRASITYEVVV